MDEEEDEEDDDKEEDMAESERYEDVPREKMSPPKIPIKTIEYQEAEAEAEAMDQEDGEELEDQAANEKIEQKDDDSEGERSEDRGESVRKDNDDNDDNEDNEGNEDDEDNDDKESLEKGEEANDGEEEKLEGGETKEGDEKKQSENKVGPKEGEPERRRPGKPSNKSKMLMLQKEVLAPGVSEEERYRYSLESARRFNNRVIANRLKLKDYMKQVSDRIINVYMRLRTLYSLVFSLCASLFCTNDLFRLRGIDLWRIF